MYSPTSHACIMYQTVGRLTTHSYVNGTKTGLAALSKAFYLKKKFLSTSMSYKSQILKV